jgi:hypothetical protein
MKVRLPTMVDDPTSQAAGLDVVENCDSQDEEFFLDGPVSRRLAVLDFDDAGALRPGARFVSPAAGRKLGRYETVTQGSTDGIYDRAFQQVCTFATVHKTMCLFEEPDALGRPLTWAFGAPQLLVVPRAGEGANAFYERESHSLQFFSISRAEDKPAACACLSRDIVSHETAHAILDGIAPDLYSAMNPQSLALHEAIADLTALIMSFRSAKLRKAVLDKTGGKIDDSSAFSAVAPEFGQARDPSGRARFLRTLLNRNTLDPNDTSKDEDGIPNRVSRYEPHSLSLVLSGALYTVMVKIHGSLLATPGWSSGKALFVGAERFKRMILRALDYLPPGDVSFLDYGRAILAADQAAHPNDSQEREWIREEFVKRAMVPSPAALDVETNLDFPDLQGMDLQTLTDSDWAAYELVGRNRAFFKIPDGVPFRVRPRLDTTKWYYLKKGEEPKPIRELLLKVSWDRKEANGAGLPFGGERQITVGTTVAIDWETRKVRARLTSAVTEEQAADRNGLLRLLADGGLLRVAEGESDRTGLRVEALDGLVRLRDTARLLHMVDHGKPTAVPPESAGKAKGAGKAPALPVPPPGVDAGAFYDLVQQRASRRGPV